MDASDIVRAIEKYRTVLTALDLEGVAFPPAQGLPTPRQSLAHCVHMLPQIERFAEAGRTEKAFRWLGFVQGVLWMNGIFTVEELKRHNVPPVKT